MGMTDSQSEVLQERVQYVYPTTVSVEHTEHGDKIIVHHAKSPAEAAMLVAETKRKLKLKELQE